MANIKLVTETGKSQPPTIICPHCRNEMLISILSFEKNIAQIAQDKCPRCGGDVFFATLVLANSDLKRLLDSIQDIVQSLNKDKAIISPN